MAVVVLDTVEFRDLYPYIEATDAQLAMYFAQAEMILSNTECSVVSDLAQRKMLLYLLTAHFALLGKDLESGESFVGRVTSASEGSVSISTAFGSSTNQANWYLQTQPGATFWQLTARYRSFLYRMGKPQMPVQRSRHR